tara:strand:+ start:638 stop:823 length:186 start_codon:yes stop_codon:yes gene_type:complete
MHEIFTYRECSAFTPSLEKESFNEKIQRVIGNRKIETHTTTVVYPPNVDYYIIIHTVIYEV